MRISLRVLISSELGTSLCTAAPSLARASVRKSKSSALSLTHARIDRSSSTHRRRRQINGQLTKVDPRRRHGKRPLPADEEEEEEEELPPPPAKYEQLDQEEKHHVVVSQLQAGATFSGGRGSSSSSVAGPSPEAYAQYYYSARADHDASAVASALAHVIRASPDQLPPQQAACLYGAAGAPVLRQGEGDHPQPQAAAHHHPGGHVAAEEEQGTRAHVAIHPLSSIDASIAKLALLLVLCARSIAKARHAHTGASARSIARLAVWKLRTVQISDTSSIIDAACQLPAAS
jgi:hypothetical protein